MDLKLDTKKALVTGAASGIGQATARQLLAEGADVVLSDLDQDGLDTAASELAPAGGSGRHKVRAFAADVRDGDAVARLREQVTAAVGGIDVLVHAAGVTGAQGQFHEIDEAGWAQTLDVDLMGAVRITQAFLPALRASGHGRIVYLASEDAVQPYDDELPYCAAKAGVLALSKGLSRTYSSEGLRVNCVSPAFIATSMTDAMMRKRAESLGVSFDDAVASFLSEKRPFLSLRRRGDAAEVASVIAFLCSEAAAFVNGSNYRVDGGSVATI